MTGRTGNVSAIEFFADMTFGQRLSLAKEFAFKHWLSVLGGTLISLLIWGIFMALCGAGLIFAFGQFADSMGYRARKTLFYILLHCCPVKE